MSTRLSFSEILEAKTERESVLSSIRTIPALYQYSYALNPDHEEFSHCDSINEVIVQRFFHSYLDLVTQRYTDFDSLKLKRCYAIPGPTDFRETDYYPELLYMIRYLRMEGIADPQIFTHWIFETWKMMGHYRENVYTQFGGKRVEVGPTAGIGFPSIKHFLKVWPDSLEEMKFAWSRGWRPGSQYMTLSSCEPEVENFKKGFARDPFRNCPRRRA